MEHSIKILNYEKRFINETFVDKELAKQKIAEIDQALQLLQGDVSGSADVLEIYPFENVPEEDKKEAIEGFVKLSAKHTLQIFRSFGLKTHIEMMVIDDNTKEEFIFSFKKVE